ncbi:MAG: D-fructose 1,6-bisphosphatase [Candidatus Bathyarchaeota archaeon]|nr:D-fructose 1,6-bisphosphatase [Candidatus Bathyarchaeota archaeon]
MSAQVNWQQIFAELKVNIWEAVKPCLCSLKSPLPDLGVGAGGDRTKPADLAAEGAIVDTLQRWGISFTLVSEESGIQAYGAKAESCYVTTDPIDGTTNLMHGLPFYAASIAISDKPMLAEVHAAMVADFIHNQTYTAIRGAGAYRNGTPIHTSKIVSLDDAVVGLDVNTYKTKPNIPTFAAIIENTRHTRHFGANALEVCYVADGSTDGFVDFRGKIRTTDVAAGFLILKEAGGIVSDPKNQPINVPLDPKQTLDFIASANMEIHKALLGLVKPNV